MFDSLRRRAADDRIASARLKALANSRDTNEEWIDESEPEPVVARPHVKTRRVPIVATAVAVVAVCTVVGLLASSPDREVPPPLPAAAVTTSEKASATIVVSVVGKVAKPGLVTLPEGARVADAIRSAGGASDVDLLALNVARRLTDGEQVYVGIPAPAEAAPAPAKPAKVDLNSASVSQLDDLPGVGSVTAQRIVDWRAQRGRFTAVEQLRQVDGIGESRYSKLKDLVTVR